MVRPLMTRFGEVEAAVSEQMGQLWVVPITGPSSDEPAYRLLEGDALNKVTVKEVSESGSVSTLVVINELDMLLSLMDGQELVGAKQNRILNTDVLVPPKSKINIPVSCVEQGRWDYTSPEFRPGKAASHSIRARKSERVRRSLQSHNVHDADQEAVWCETADSLDSSATSSTTGALSDAYDQCCAELETRRSKLRMPEDAVGLAMFYGRTFLGLDLFDRHTTLRHFWESLVDSYSIDFLQVVQPGQEEPYGPSDKDVKRLLRRVDSGAWEPFDSPGVGRDHRLDHEDLSGSALVWNEQTAIHVQLFPKGGGDASGQPGATPRRSRIHRHYVGPELLGDE